MPRPQLNTIYVQCALINLYGHFGDIDTAKQLFYYIPNRHRNAVALNTMMSSLSVNGYNAKTLWFYDQFQSLHNETSHVVALKACVHLNDGAKGRDIINKHIGSGSLKQHSNDLLNSLIHFHGHFGDIASAQRVFEHLSSNNKVDQITVNSMLKTLAKNGHCHRALDLFDEHSERHLVDGISLIFALQSCVQTDSVERGKQIIDRNLNQILHRNLNRNRNDGIPIELQTALISFYGHSKDLAAALDTFHRIPTHNGVSINVMMRAFIDNEGHRDALSLYHEYRELIASNHVAHILALKACIGCNDQKRGQSIHSAIDRVPELSRNVMLQTALIDLYGHFGRIEDAVRVFDGIAGDRRDGISVSAMLKCYVNNDCNAEALALYDRNRAILKGTESGHLLAVKASTKMDDFHRGMAVINEHQFECRGSIEMKTTVIDFYGHFGRSEDAVRVFEGIAGDEMEIETVNSMMNALCNCGRNAECIQLFEDMATKMHNVQRDVISFNTAIKASLNGHFVHFGQQIYGQLMRERRHWVQWDKSVQLNLINMFSEFGMLSICKEIFDGALRRELEVWNVTIHAFGKSGDLETVQALYRRMKEEGDVAADSTTFAILINAHSHCGDVETAQDIWSGDIGDERVKYDCFVVTAMVDCLSRSGWLQRARAVIGEYEEMKGMEAESKAMWMSLLSACIKFRDYDRANDIYCEFQRRHSKNERYMSAAGALMQSCRQRFER